MMNEETTSPSRNPVSLFFQRMSQVRMQFSVNLFHFQHCLWYRSVCVLYDSRENLFVSNVWCRTNSIL